VIEATGICQQVRGHATWISMNLTSRNATHIVSGIDVTSLVAKWSRAYAGVFPEQAAALDPQPCSVQEFPSAAACLIGHPAPHFILFTADPDPDTGHAPLAGPYESSLASSWDPIGIQLGSSWETNSPQGMSFPEYILHLWVSCLNWA